MHTPIGFTGIYVLLPCWVIWIDSCIFDSIFGVATFDAFPVILGFEDGIDIFNGHFMTAFRAGIWRSVYFEIFIVNGHLAIIIDCFQGVKGSNKDEDPYDTKDDVDIHGVDICICRGIIIYCLTANKVYGYKMCIFCLYGSYNGIFGDIWVWGSGVG